MCFSYTCESVFGIHVIVHVQIYVNISVSVILSLCYITFVEYCPYHAMTRVWSYHAMSHLCRTRHDESVSIPRSISIYRHGKMIIGILMYTQHMYIHDQFCALLLICAEYIMTRVCPYDAMTRVWPYHAMNHLSRTYLNCVKAWF